MLQITRVVFGFRHAPGNATFLAVFDLPPHAQAIALFKQAARRRAHHQRGHQIFKHRTRPGDQGRCAIEGRQGTAETEPVAGGEIALGDGEETRQPSLGGEKIVIIGIQGAIGDAIADRQQLTLGVEQKTEFHGHGRRPGRLGQCRQPVQ